MFRSAAPSDNPVKLSGIEEISPVPVPTVVAVPPVGVTEIKLPPESKVIVPVTGVETPEVKSVAGSAAE